MPLRAFCTRSYSPGQYEEILERQQCICDRLLRISKDPIIFEVIHACLDDECFLSSIEEIVDKHGTKVDFLVRITNTYETFMSLPRSDGSDNILRIEGSSFTRNHVILGYLEHLFKGKELDEIVHVCLTSKQFMNVVEMIAFDSESEAATKKKQIRLTLRNHLTQAYPPNKTTSAQDFSGNAYEKRTKVIMRLLKQLFKRQ